MDAAAVYNSLEVLFDQQLAILQAILRTTDVPGTTGFTEALRCFDMFERHLHDCVLLHATLRRVKTTTEYGNDESILNSTVALALTIVHNYGSWNRPKSFVRCFRSCLVRISQDRPPFSEENGFELIEGKLTTGFITLLTGSTDKGIVVSPKTGRVGSDWLPAKTSKYISESDSRSLTDVLTFLSEIFRISSKFTNDDLFRKLIIPWLDASVYADEEIQLSIVNTIGKLMHSFSFHLTITPESLNSIFRHRFFVDSGVSIGRLQIRFLSLSPVFLVTKMMTAELFSGLLHACKQSSVIAKQSMSIIQNCIQYADENHTDDVESDLDIRLAPSFPPACVTARQRLSLLDSVLALLVSSQIHAVRPHLLSIKRLSLSSNSTSEIEQLIWWRLFHHEHAHVRVWAMRLFLSIRNGTWGILQSFTIDHQPVLMDVNDFFDGLNSIELGALVENLVEIDETIENSTGNSKSPSITVLSIMQHAVTLESRLKSFIISLLTSCNAATDAAKTSAGKDFVRNLIFFAQSAFGSERGRKWSFLSLTLLVRSLSGCIQNFLAVNAVEIDDSNMLCEYHRSVQLYFEMCNNWNLADRTYLIRFRPFPPITRLFSNNLGSNATLSSFMLEANALCATRVADYELLCQIISEQFSFSVHKNASVYAVARQLCRQIDSFTMFAVFTCCLNIPAPDIPEASLVEFFRNPKPGFSRHLAAELGRTLMFYQDFVQKSKNKATVDWQFLLMQYILWVCWMTCYDDADNVETNFSSTTNLTDNFNALFSARHEFASELRLILLEMSEIEQSSDVNGEPETDDVVSVVLCCNELRDLRKIYTEAPQLALYIAYQHVLLKSRGWKQAETDIYIQQIFSASGSVSCKNFYDRFLWQQECVYFLPDDQLVMLRASRLIFFSLLRKNLVKYKEDATVCEQFCHSLFMRMGEFRDHVDFPRFVISYAELLADAAGTGCCSDAIFQLFCDTCQITCCRPGLAHKMFEIFVFRAFRDGFKYDQTFFMERVLVNCMLYGGTASAATESTKITLKNQFPNIIADTLFKFYAVEAENNDFSYQPEVYSDGHTRALGLLFVLSRISSNSYQSGCSVAKILLVLLEQDEAGRTSLAARRRQAIANSDRHLTQLRTWQAICAITTQIVVANGAAERENHAEAFKTIESICQQSLTNDVEGDSVQPSVRVYMEFTWAVVKVGKLRENFAVITEAQQSNVEKYVQNWMEDEMLRGLLDEAKKARPRVAISLLHTMNLCLQLMLNDKVMPQKFQKGVIDACLASWTTAAADSSRKNNVPLYYFMLCTIFEWFVASEQLLMRVHGVELSLKLIELLPQSVASTGPLPETWSKTDHVFLLRQMRAILLCMKNEPNQNSLTQWLRQQSDYTASVQVHKLTTEYRAAVSVTTKKPTKTPNSHEKVQLFRLATDENQHFLLFWDNFFVDIPEKCGADTREHIPSYVMHSAYKQLSRLSDDKFDFNHCIFGSDVDESTTGEAYFKRLTNVAASLDSAEQQVVVPAKPSESALFKQKKYRPATSTNNSDVAAEAAPRPRSLVTYTWSPGTPHSAGSDSNLRQLTASQTPAGLLVGVNQAEGHFVPTFISTLPQDESASFYDAPFSRPGSGSRHGWQICVVATLLEKLPNLGGLCRTGEVLGVEELVIPNLKAVTQHAFTVLSVGAEKWLKLTEVKRADLAAFLTVKRQEERLTIIGLEQTDNSVLLGSKECNLVLEKNKKLLLVLGAEETGLPGDVLGHMDACVEIPQYGQLGSLNVHTAASICLWHIISHNSHQ